MKYLILVHSDAHFLERWAGLTDAQRADFGLGHRALTDELLESGELVVSGGLADPALGRRVAVRDGATTVTDGPFAEVKEHLAGFYLVECTAERSLEIAARVPDAVWGLVEVRPVLGRGDVDL
ncbi:YciI family protein [Pseudonocardia petroleophila]|uniref:YciI family protein n=1 Tax=Pseudonocardia petroleophila TaxID=37331 RepID=A0A7G7MML3_9PSEU|nr:YciI family protein [Pseudonocardia petroleophila]QNG54024.1 YciI family protein [Pseudonocardia petroleophila]